MPVYIPPEILDHIFTFARGSPPTWDEDLRWTTDSDDEVHQPHPNATLLSASLVSKAWAEAAQRVLYLHAVFPSSPREPSYSSWIESDARRRYRTMSLWIRPCKTAENFAQVLDNSQGLVSLTLGQPLSGTKQASWAVLRSPGLKDLKSLSLPFIDYLIPSGESVGPLPFSLNSLAFDLFTERGSGAALLSTLLAASRTTLHTLSIRQSQDPSVSEMLVPIPLPNLRHLILEEYSEVPTCLGNGLKSFRSLEKLELRGQTIAFEGYQSYWNLSGLYFDSTIATLPTPNLLRHLVLGIDKGSYIAGVEVKLSHPALAGLEVLELMYLWRSDVVSSEGADLIETCKRRLITLLCADGPVGTED